MSASNIYTGNVIDFEASGLGKGSYPIEVGIVLDNGQAYHSLIKPQLGWQHWSDSAQSIHGISRKELLKRGKPIKQVCAELNQLCAGQTLFTDCWVADGQWLSQLFAAAKMTPSFTLSPMEYFLSDTELDTWGKQKRALAADEGIELHRALQDAYVIKALLDDKTTQTTAKASRLYSAPHLASSNRHKHNA